MKSFSIVYYFVVLAIITLFAQPGLGAQKQTEFNTMLRMEENYQDNVFLSEDDPQSGASTNIIPGINFRRATKRLVADFEYNAHVKYYSYDTSREGTFEDKKYDIFHEGGLYLELNTWFSGQKGMELILDERYYDNQATPSLSGSSRSQQNDYFTNTLKPQIVLRLSKKLKISAIYENEIVRFTSESANDTTQYVYGLDIEYFKSRRSYFQLAFRQIQKDFLESSDFAVQEGSLVARRILNRTWSGGIVLAYQMRAYAEGAEVEDWSGLVMTAFIKAVRKKKLDIGLNYQNKRSNFDSFVFYKIDRWDLKSKWTPTRKVSLDFNIFYQTDSYDFPSGRQDLLSGASSQISFHPKKWINWGIGYSRSKRDSNQENLSYVNSVYYLSLTLKKQ